MPKPVGSRNDNAGRLPLPPTNPDEDVCIRVFVPNSQYHRNLLFGLLELGANWLTYELDPTGRGARDAAARWRQALIKTYDGLATGCDDKPVPPPDTIEILQILSTFECSCEEDELPALTHYINENGLYIIVQDGCGSSCIFGPLPKGVIGASGNPVGIRDGGSNIPFLPAPDTNVDCYRDAAFDYLLSRYRQFTERVVGIAVTGIGELLEPVEAAIPFEDLAAELLLGGPISSLFENFTVSQLVGAATNSATESALKPRIPNGAFTRDSLTAWVSNAPVVTGAAVPVRSQMQAWARFANIRALNTDLAKFRDQCVGGTNIIQTPNPTPVIVTGDFTLTPVESFTIAPGQTAQLGTYNDPIVNIAVDVSTSGVNPGQRPLFLTIGNASVGIDTVYDEMFWGDNAVNGTLAASQTIPGYESVINFYTSLPGVSPRTGAVTLRNDDDVETLTFGNVWIVTHTPQNP